MAFHLSVSVYITLRKLISQSIFICVLTIIVNAISSKKKLTCEMENSKPKKEKRKEKEENASWYINGICIKNSKQSIFLSGPKVTAMRAVTYLL